MSLEQSGPVDGKASHWWKSIVAETSIQASPQAEAIQTALNDLKQQLSADKSVTAEKIVQLRERIRRLVDEVKSPVWEEQSWKWLKPNGVVYAEQKENYQVMAQRRFRMSLELSGNVNFDVLPGVGFVTRTKSLIPAFYSLEENELAQKSESLPPEFAQDAEDQQVTHVLPDGKVVLLTSSHINTYLTIAERNEYQGRFKVIRRLFKGNGQWTGKRIELIGAQFSKDFRVLPDGRCITFGKFGVVQFWEKNRAELSDGLHLCREIQIPGLASNNIIVGGLATPNNKILVSDLWGNLIEIDFQEAEPKFTKVRIPGLEMHDHRAFAKLKNGNIIAVEYGLGAIFSIRVGERKEDVVMWKSTLGLALTSRQSDSATQTQILHDGRVLFCTNKAIMEVRLNEASYSVRHLISQRLLEQTLPITYHIYSFAMQSDGSIILVTSHGAVKLDGEKLSRDASEQSAQAQDDSTQSFLFNTVAIDRLTSESSG